MFVRICLCDIILYTWFGKKWKRLKKFWSWKICLVYPYFFKHLSLSMPISFMLIEKRVYALSPWGTFQMNTFFGGHCSVARQGKCHKVFQSWLKRCWNLTCLQLGLELTISSIFCLINTSCRWCWNIS